MVLPVLEEYHRNGILIDPAHMAKLSAKLRELEAQTAASIEQCVGRPVNWNSPDAVSQLIFKDLGLKPPGRPKLTGTGDVSSADEVLATIRDQHPVVRMIQDGRGFSKLRGTYSDKLPLLVWPDGRIRGTYKYTRTDTGRLAMDTPNLMNIPARSELGNEVRAGFVAQKGCKLASADFSQIEMVVAADLAGDQTMLNVFRNGLDIHTKTVVGVENPCMGHGREFWERMAYQNKLEEAGQHVEWVQEEKKAWKEFKKLKRLVYKTVGFGLLYGQTDEGLQGNIEVNGGPRLPIEEVARISKAWWGMYQGIADWMEEQHRRLRRFGMVWTFCGRIRRIPGAKSRIRRVVNEALRAGGNMPVQGGAQELIKLAMAQVADLVEWFRDVYPNCIVRPLLQIHDELIFELSEDIAEEFCLLLRAIMESVARLAVPIGSSSVLGNTWADLKG